MRSGVPSLTARSAAAHRAAHQVIEGGRVFTDPLAIRLLGESAADIAREARAHPERRLMRLFIAARSRFAEDALDAAVAAGVRQLVVLGAGLDTYAYRNPHSAVGLTVFEVDHPSTQAWKRERLAAAGIDPPSSLTFVPVDFARRTLTAGLRVAGFDPHRPSFFSWLGVVPYLTRENVFATLRSVAELPGGAEIVFDYGDPPSALPPDQRAAHDARAARVAALGEPWLTYFEADQLAADLRDSGFTTVEDLGRSALAARYFGAPADAPRQPGAHVVRAASPTRHR
ncbi:class I SAM-dependent methyltransferase [Streptomyces sp. NPDC020883]|uniref:class I SAM-dependent methyltransferase n=1 Tax=Streptomyces sp. NPDC020883 TaxID=3365099 RepID=UPI0037AD238E